MSRRNRYLSATLLASVLIVTGLFLLGGPTSQASGNKDVIGALNTNTYANTPNGQEPDVFQDMPDYMKANHGKYDNRLTALFEAWLQGEDVAGLDAREKEYAGPKGIFSPIYGPDVRMSNSAFAGSQNEFQIDINPLDSNFAIGTSNDGRTAGVGIYRTSDRGLTWTAFDAPIGTAACCDPAVAYASDGSVYVGVLDTSPSGQYTLYSTDNGATFVNRGLLPLPDRNNIATDPSNANVLYTTYSDLASGGSNRIKGYKSTDRGVTWGTSFFIGDAAPPSGYQQSSQPQVASNGWVYVGYQEYENSSIGCSAAVRNEVSRSTDSGATWAVVSSLTIVQGGACSSAQAGRGLFCINAGGSSFRSRSHPIMGIHPTNPMEVYMFYTGGDLESAYTCGTSNGFHSDALFRRSTDGGLTFSAPIKINTDPQGKDQYYGWIDVAPNGTIWAGWHDRRDDANNFQHRWYQAHSTDGGLTWLDQAGVPGNDQVADVATQPATFIGDYAGIAATNEIVLPMWWDARNTASGDPYTDPNVPVQGTPTSTVTPGGPTSTRTNTAVPTSTTTRTNTAGVATATVCATNYTIATGTNPIVPGTTNTGSLCDDCVTDVTIPFSFTLYDQSFTQVGLDSNGKAHFPTGASVFTNTCLPQAAVTYTIYPYWEDQRTDGTGCTGGCGIFTSTTGVAPNRIFNIEWRTTYFSGGGFANYELRLYEGAPSRFEVIFGALSQGNTSATSGVQKNGTLFTQYFCNGVGPAATGSQLYTLGSCGTAGPTSTVGATSTRTSTSSVATATCVAGGGPIVVSGALATGDPTLATRLFRADPGSTCAAPVAYPGPSGTGPFFYDTYTYPNTTGSAACITVNVDPLTCIGTPFIHASAYLNTFDPNNLATNFLGTWGASQVVPTDFSVTVPAGSSIVVVVNAVTAGAGGACPGYTLTITGLGGGGCATGTVVPTIAATSTRTNTVAATVAATATCPPVAPVVPHTVGLGNPGERNLVSNGNGPAKFNAGVGAGSGEPANGFQPVAPITFQVDDGTEENGVGLSNGTTNFPAIWMNRYSPANGDFPLQLNQISILFPAPALAGRDITGLAINLLVYLDADRNNDPSNAVKLTQLPATITVANGTAFSNYIVNLLIATPGDIYIGFADTYNSGGVSPVSRPAALDTTASQMRSWVAGMSMNADPDYDNLANNDLIGTIDDLGLPGNWLIRASGETQVGGGCPSPVATSTRTNTAVPPTSTRTSTAVPPTSTSTSAVTSTSTSTIVPTATATACTFMFSDVPTSNEFYPFIRCLACRGIISGYSDGTFRPNNPIIRGQIAKMVSNSAGFSEDPGAQIYTDVDSSNPFYSWINRLSRRGYMGGYPCGGPFEPCDGGNRPYFRPFANATRGQLSKIVANAAGITTPVPAGTQTYTDVPPSNPFYVFIERLTALGVMSGYPCGGPGEPCDASNRPYFRPFAQVTRGQASKIVSNTFFPNCQSPLAMVGLTSSNGLIRFNSNAPGTLIRSMSISGLQAGEQVLGIDFRPATGQLYGLGSTNRLYTIDSMTGAATAITSTTFITPLVGTNFGFDFNPTVDRIRTVSDADQTLRLHPVTGAVAAQDGTLTYAAADPNFGQDPQVASAGYTNSFPGSTSTTLYDIDTGLDILVTQNPPNAGTLNTVGPLGFSTTGDAGFDIRGTDTVGYAALQVTGNTVSNLYSINLTTGAATLMGSSSIGGGNTLRGLAIGPDNLP